MLSVFSQFIFGGSGLFGARADGIKLSSGSWKEKSICFDLRASELELDSTEQLIACFFPIEDVKGNQDELGLLKVTNLRLIWICCDKKRVNLSIGWRTVTLTFEHSQLKDSLGSSMSSLCVLTKYDGIKYEFVFSKMPAYSDSCSVQGNYGLLVQLMKYRPDKGLSLSQITPMYLCDPYDVVFKVWQSYRGTQLFRNCRANLTNLLTGDHNSTASQPFDIKIGHFNKLPSEEVIDMYPEVVQLESRSTTHIGSLVITNIRLLWFDGILALRNLSIPYLRVTGLKMKQADRIVVNTHDYLATTNQIEFRTTKKTKIEAKTLFSQIQSLHRLYKDKPRFGPESCEDCLRFMSYLRPFDSYLESFDGSLVRAAENFGPAFLITTIDDATPALNRNHIMNPDDELGEMDTDKNESDLAEYSAKLNNYLDEQPVRCDMELVYSSALGLTVERNSKDLDIERIWHLDL